MTDPRDRTEPTRTALGRFLDDDRGVYTIEFVVMFPFLVLIVFMFAEIGIFAGRTVLLKRGVDIAIRDVRLGIVDPNNLENEMRFKICANAFLIDSCANDLTLDFTPLAEVTQIAGVKQTVVCRDRSAPPDSKPLTNFDAGVEGEIMLVRACLLASPVFPGTGFGASLQWDGDGYWITVVTAFMNESSRAPASS